DTLTPGGLLYLEVPDANYIEEKAAFFELHNAHVQYFHESNLKAIIQGAGLQITKKKSIKDGHDFGLLLQQNSQIGVYTRRTTHLNRTDLRLRLQQRFVKVTEAFTGQREIILYGATWQAVSLMSAIGASIKVSMALDDNQDYADHYLFNVYQKVPVIPPEEAKFNNDQSILITAHLHDESIRSHLQELGSHGNIVSL
ncbi:MAG: hypothetical protein KAJ10_06700, partial [Thermodesulfovibrionia bacterium]|nr:hypothetical protein [Thermodesulfovibrionia bacterium]